jgi:hypothetical protein
MVDRSGWQHPWGGEALTAPRAKEPSSARVWPLPRMATAVRRCSDRTFQRAYHEAA